MNRIITLTTDFGALDSYVGQIKGVILNINRAVVFVDITHDIAPFSILEASFVIEGFYKYFPSGSMHLAVVDPGVGTLRRALAIRTKDHTFIGPDNGIFSMVLKREPACEIREISNASVISGNPYPTFHGRDIFAPAAAWLAQGMAFEQIGLLVSDPVLIATPAPREIANGIEGEIIHVDRFGNLSTNIRREDITGAVAEVKVGDIAIHGLRKSFAESPLGAPLALINSFGYLEIAVNSKAANETLGLGPGMRARVLFEYPNT